MKGADFKKMIRSGWVEENINDNEPIVFKRPRVIGAQRVLNKEQRKRFSFVVSPDDYAELAALREAYILTCGDNPTLATHGIITALKEFSLKSWLDEQQENDFIMGRDIPPESE